MKGILLAGVLAALTVVSAEWLSCVQCNSLENSCANQNATECPSNARVSCSSFLMNFSLGAVYRDKACSAQNCSDGLMDFKVHVSNEESFHFESECCRGDSCKNARDASAQKDEFSMECPACYSNTEMSCVGKYWKCQPGERCVNLVAEFNETEWLMLKGCSNINNSTCQLLSSGNQTIGKVWFKMFECIDNNNATSAPIPTKATLTHSTASKVSFVPAGLAGLLLLGLLL